MIKERSLQVVGGMTVEQVFHFVHISNQFNSEVVVQSDQVESNGKGYLGMISFMMTIKEEAPIDIIVKGSDAAEAIRAIEYFIISGCDSMIWKKQHG